MKSIWDTEETEKFTVLGADAEQILEGIRVLRHNLLVMDVPQPHIVCIAAHMQPAILDYINAGEEFAEFTEISHLYQCEIEWVTFH